MGAKAARSNPRHDLLYTCLSLGLSRYCRPNHRYGLRVPAMVISPYARAGYIDHQTLSFDAYLKFAEDLFLGGQRLDPANDGRPDPRPSVRENEAILGDLM